MKLINIRDVEDNFERYRMPAIESKIKPQGQYSVTYVHNLPKIAKALHVDLNCLVRYFGWSFNTKSKFDAGTGELEMKGAFDDEKLLKTLRSFINQYVLCSKCGLPELDYKPKKNNKVNDSCRACGNKSSHDFTDRVYKVMHQGLIDNPPPKAINIPKPNIDECFNDLRISDDEGWSIDVSNEAAEKRRQEAIGDSKILEKLLS